MPPESGLTSWILAGVAAVVSALATAIAVLWKSSESRNATAITKLESKVSTLEDKQDASEKAILECEKDRSQLRSMCDYLRERLSGVEATLKGNT